MQGEKRRGACLLSPSHVLLARPVIRYMVSNCQFIFLLRDSENDPYPKKPLPKKKKRNRPLKKIPAIFSYPKKSQKDPSIIPQGPHSHILMTGGSEGFFWVWHFGQKGFFWVYERRRDFFGSRKQHRDLFGYCIFHQLKSTIT